MRPSIHASDPSINGAPVRGAADQPTPANLSSLGVAKPRHSASWSAPRMLMHKPSEVAMRGHDVDVNAGQTATSGGSIDRDTKLWAVKPTGLPPSRAVTLVT